MTNYAMLLCQKEWVPKIELLCMFTICRDAVMERIFFILGSFSPTSIQNKQTNKLGWAKWT